MAGTGDCSLLRKLKNTRPPHTFGIKSFGQIDGKVEVQIEIGLNNNIQDNYLYNVDVSAAQNSRSTYLHCKRVRLIKQSQILNILLLSLETLASNVKHMASTQWKI